MSIIIIKDLKPTGCAYIDAQWSVDDSSARNDLYLVAENMGYKLIDIYNNHGHLAIDDCCGGSLFLEPIKQKKNK
jgi:hypothetical protein